MDKSRAFSGLQHFRGKQNRGANMSVETLNIKGVEVMLVDSDRGGFDICKECYFGIEDIHGESLCDIPVEHMPKCVLEHSYAKVWKQVKE